MKILMTLMGLEIGGAETHVVELSKELKRLGHDVIVASNGGVYEQALREAGISHHKIPMHQRNVFTMLRSLRLLRKLIRAEKPDLVHAHARIPAFLCGILHRQMHFPFITSAHWVFEVTPLLRLISDWGQRSVAVSEDIKKYLMVNYRVPKDVIHVTINGIDTNQFAPGVPDAALKRELGIGSGPVIGTVSRLDESRELASKYLIAVMPQVLERFPDAQLLVVGGGNQEQVLRAEADAVNRQFGRNAIIMTGPRTDIAKLVSVSDIFVGVSRAALEAMAAEKPTVLAGNEGYIGTFRQDVLACAQDSNFCCRGCDEMTKEQLLKDVLELLAADRDTTAALGRFGRQVILDQYSVARMTQDYMDAYTRLLNPKKEVKAAVSGYYGYGNLGDDSILVAMSQQFVNAGLPVQLTVLSRKPAQTTGQYGLRAVPRFSPVQVLRTLRRSDLLISGGGSLLQDKTSTRSLLYYLGVIQLAKALGKPVFLYANGIGPVTGKINRVLVKRCLQNCDVITLRDQESLQELKSLGINRENIPVTGDPAFTLTASDGGEALLAQAGVPANSNIVGISLRRLKDSGTFPKEFARLCDRLVRELGKTIVFIVMQESEDEAISIYTQGLMEEASYLIKSPGDPLTMLSAIGQMEAMISIRLHSIIFAASEQVPVVGCVYDPKVSAFLNILGMPSCGTPDGINADQAYQVVTDLLSRLPEHRKTLADRVATATSQAESTAQLLEQLLRELESA